MKFGYFDDSAKEYVITDPKTPYPWINYLGNEDFFGLISNTAGGYTFYKDAKFRRLTRYRYNNTPIDNGGRYFYINDGGDVWSPGWKPVKADLDEYRCHHGMSYTKIFGSRNGIEAEALYFVPLNSWAEVHRIKLKNTSNIQKSIKLYSFAEWCLWNAQDDGANFQRNLSTGEVEVDGSTLYHKTEFKERRNHYAFYSVNAPLTGFDTDRESFLGLYNDFDKPEAVFEGGAKNSIAHGWSPIASHEVEISLEPGEEQTLCFVLGYVELEPDQKWHEKGSINKSPAKDLIARFDTAEKVNKELKDLADKWSTLLGAYQLNSGDARLDRMVNIWNQYQCMVTFNMSRSASFFESGIGRGMGFRDSNQDLIGFIHQAPERAKERILDIAATQKEDGSAYHQYQPLTKRGNNELGGDFNDDPMWLVLSTSEYIRETGDYSILDEQVPFDNDENNCASLFEHLKRSFFSVSKKLGPHELPLIGRADWNDCLNLNCFSEDPNESFQTTGNKQGDKAESLMIAGQFVLYGNELAELSKHYGKPELADELRPHIDTMVDSIKKHGWDGNWFLRAYDYYGNKVGSHENEEGKIFIESQGFCGMAKIGLEEGLVEKALDSVKEHLDCDYGLVLQQPAFTKYHIEYGEISTYPAGYKENAGIFCHNNPWIMIAETELGRGEAAFDYYKKITPAYFEDISDLHKVEPYAYCQMIAGKDAFKPGEGKNSWLTGTAAWNFYAVTQFILGVRADFNGLTINPCIPSSWDGFQLQRKFRGATYKIKVNNPNHVSKGVTRISVNNEIIDGQTITSIEQGQTYIVDVTMG